MYVGVRRPWGTWNSLLDWVRLMCCQRRNGCETEYQRKGLIQHITRCCNSVHYTGNVWGAPVIKVVNKKIDAWFETANWKTACLLTWLCDLLSDVINTTNILLLTDVYLFICVYHVTHSSVQSAVWEQSIITKTKIRSGTDVPLRDGQVWVSTFQISEPHTNEKPAQISPTNGLQTETRTLPIPKSCPMSSSTCSFGHASLWWCVILLGEPLSSGKAVALLGGSCD